MQRNDLINGRTAEQIKRALACVNQDIDACVECPYETMNCMLENNIDALSYIEQLEMEISRRDALLAEMGVRLPKEDSDERR